MTLPVERSKPDRASIASARRLADRCWQDDRQRITARTPAPYTVAAQYAVAADTSPGASVGVVPQPTSQVRLGKTPEVVP